MEFPVVLGVRALLAYLYGNVLLRTEEPAAQL